MDPVFENPSHSSSVTIDSNAHAPVVVSRHRLTHAAIIAQMLITETNNRQTRSDYVYAPADTTSDLSCNTMMQTGFFMTQLIYNNI